MAAPRTIILKGNKSRYEEARAAGTIRPGHLIKLDANNEVVVHATAGGFGETAFAIEDGLIGRTIDTNYVDDELVRYHVALRGDEIYALLPAAAVAVVAGDHLISSGDGTLKKTTGTPAQIIAVAREAVDNSGGGSPARIKCRIL